MTNEISAILDAIAASADPLRAYITGLEGQIQTLGYTQQTAVDDATNPLRQRITQLESDLNNAQADFTARLASDVQAATAPLIADVERLNAVIDAIRATLPQ